MIPGAAVRLQRDRNARAMGETMADPHDAAHRAPSAPDAPSSDDDLRPVVAASYDALADVLEAIGEDDWDTPSLCEGWRVREVVAHLTMPARYDEAAFMAELRARDF